MNSFKLFSFLAACVLANGTPLESPTEDFSKFFVSPRIVGGVDAPDNHSPYQAALVFGQQAYPSLMCGASIVSKQHLLTAAHCIDPFVWGGELLDTLHARVGSNIWSSGGQVVRFNGYKNHPKWDPFYIKYDIGFLYTTIPLDFNKRVQPVAINFEKIAAGTKSFVTGWGLTSAWGIIPKYKQILNVTTISPEECAKKALEASLGWFSPHIDPVAEICTFHSIGHGMCNGDSGSALIYAERFSLIGVVSWGFPCAVGGPDVFASASGSKGFIQVTLGHDKQ